MVTSFSIEEQCDVILQALELENQVKHDQANKLYLNVLEGRSADSIHLVIDCFTKLAKRCELYFEHTIAREYFRYIIAFGELYLGEYHSIIAGAQYNIAELYKIQGRYIEAEQSYHAALEITLHSPFQSELYILTRISNGIAQLYTFWGRYIDAECFYTNMLNICYKRKNELCIAYTYDGLASLYYHLGKCHTAQSLQVVALKIVECKLGLQHWETMRIMEHLAQILDTRGNIFHAEDIYITILKNCHKYYGGDHVETANAMVNLATLYTKFEISRTLHVQLYQAEELYNDAYHIYYQVYGPDHPNTIMIALGRAKIAERYCQIQTAINLYHEVLEYMDYSIGLEHPYTITTLYELVRLYYTHDIYNNTFNWLQKRLILVFDKIHEPEHIDNIVVRNIRIQYYLKTNNFIKAKILCEKQLQIFNMAYGPDHRYTKQELERKTYIYSCLGL